ncbi:MAG: hypothetical protein KDD73_15995 [Anaerolineales bacterium]|nr:hypothetical protein [Anaerolineales bacterium]
MLEGDNSLKAEAVREVSGQLAALHAYLATVEGDLRTVIALSQQALKKLPTADRLLRGLMALNLSNAHHLLGDAVSAQQARDEAYAISQATDDVQGLFVRAGLHLLQGRLHQAARSYRQILQRAQPGQFLRYAACIELGEILYQWNDLEAAAFYFQEGLTQSSVGEAIGAVISMHASLARIYQAQGKRAAAQAEMEAALRQAEKQASNQLLPQLRAAAARLALLQGEGTRASPGHREAGYRSSCHYPIVRWSTSPWCVSSLPRGTRRRLCASSINSSKCSLPIRGSRAPWRFRCCARWPTSSRATQLGHWTPSLKP